MAKARDIKEELIKKRTGKSSDEWYKLIDGFGTTDHTQITKILWEKFGVNPWWAQAITNRYEWKRGLRKV